jgi:hypothetical protein
MSQAQHPFDPRSFTEGLYQSNHEHDACGVGFVAHIKGQKTHDIVSQALKILENLQFFNSSCKCPAWPWSISMRHPP